MSRTLVTGGLGFLGAALTRALVAKGENVRVLDNASRGSLGRLGDVAEHVELISGDIRDPSVVDKAVQGVDRIWHLAYVNGTEFFYSKPAYVLDVGIKGMVNILDAAMRHNVPELIAASSSEAYQTAPVVPTAEDVPLVVPDPFNPRYSYGGGKILTELMAINYGREHFKRVALFRPHNVYGPAMGYEHVIPQFCTRMVSLMKEHPQGTIPFPIQGSGTQTRSFVYIDDFTDGLMLLADKAPHLSLYHIGTMEEVTIADVAHAVGAAYGREISLQPGKEVEGGTPRRCPDIAKIKALGFSPKIGLKEGVTKAALWYKEHPTAPAAHSGAQTNIFLTPLA